MELQAAKGTGPEWQTGSPGSYNKAHWSTGKKPDSLHSHFSNFGKEIYGTTWQYGGEDVPIVNSPGDLVASTYKGYKDAIGGAETEDDMNKAINNVNSVYESTFARTRTDSLLNFSMEDY